VPNISEVPLGVLVIDFVQWLCGPWVAFGQWAHLPYIYICGVEYMIDTLSYGKENNNTIVICKIDGHKVLSEVILPIPETFRSVSS
jgi:hypothetical protein